MVLRKAGGDLLKKEHRNALIVTVIGVVVLAIVFGVQAYFFSPNPNWSEWFALVDSVWVDTVNGYSLTPDRMTECGILSNENNSLSMTVHFDYAAKDTDQDKDMYMTELDPQSPKEGLQEEQEILASGGWEYDWHEDTLIIWIDTFEGCTYDDLGTQAFVFHRQQ